MPHSTTATPRSWRARSRATLFRYDYARAHARTKQLAKALMRLGIAPGDRVGTLAWNTHRHFEMFYGTSGFGAVLHTVNPRLYAEQLVYIINHAEDIALFVDAATLPIVEELAPRLTTIRHFVMMADRAAHAGEVGASRTCSATRSCSPPRATTSPGRSSTSARPRASATPRARPATPRASSTRIAPRCWWRCCSAGFVGMGARNGSARDADADGADVPRQRLAVPVPGADDGLAPDPAGAQLRARDALRAARRRARDGDLRRADACGSSSPTGSRARARSSPRCASRCRRARRRRARWWRSSSATRAWSWRRPGA